MLCCNVEQKLFGDYDCKTIIGGNIVQKYEKWDKKLLLDEAGSINEAGSISEALKSTETCWTHR